MIPELKRIAELQLDYSSENTPPMQERCRIIRSDLPAVLQNYRDKFEESLGRFSSGLEIEGSDGIGRKTQAPWVRLFSKDLSPSATTGYYVVIHFSVDSERCFVTIGFGATTWNSERGDLEKSSDTELERKKSWALAYAEGRGKRYFRVWR